MAKTLSNAGIGEGQEIEAHHVSQSIDAFTGVEDYDISLSGSFNLTGSLIQKTGDVKFESLLNVAPGNYVAFDLSTQTLSYATTESIISANAAAISGAFDAASASIDAAITALSASLTSSIGSISASFVTTIDSVSSSLSSSIGDVTSSLTAVSAAFATAIDAIVTGSDDDWFDGTTFITTSKDTYIVNSFLSVGGNITGSGNLEVGGFVSASSVTASKVFIYQPNSNISSPTIIPELKFKHFDYTDFTIKNDISPSPGRSTLIISSSLGASPYDFTAWVNIIPSTEFSASDILMPNITEGGNKFLSWDSSTGKIYHTSSTPGGGGSDNDWFDGTTYITTSKDTYITGSLIVSGSTTVISGSEIYMPNLSEAGGNILTWDITTGKLSYTSSIAGGGGVDNDWKLMPGGYMTTSFDVQITGGFYQTAFGEVYFTNLDNDNTPYYVSYNTSTGKITYQSTSSIVTNVSNSLVATINSVSSSISSSIGDISASFATTINNLELGDDDWYSGSGFITTSRASVRITGSLIASSSEGHLIRGDVLFAGDSFDVRNSNILLGNGLSDNIIITGSIISSGSTFEVTASNFRVTSSDFFISSSDIRFPVIPLGSSDYYLAYNSSTGRIAYNSTSSIAGGGGGSDNDWYEGSGFITTSNQVQITGSLIVSGSGITGSDTRSALFDLFGVSRSRGELPGDVIKWDNVNGVYTNGPNVVFTGFNISSSNPIVNGTEQTLTNDNTLNIVNAISYSKTGDVVDVTIDTAFNRINPTDFSSSYNLAITGSVFSSGSTFEAISDNFILDNNNIRITSSTIGISSSGNFIVTASNFIVSSSDSLIRGDVVFVGDSFDVKNDTIKLGNISSDNIIITGSIFSRGTTFEVTASSFNVTASNFFISSSDIRFPVIPLDSSDYYLTYNPVQGAIAYNLTSSIAGGGGGSDNDWYDGGGFITTSNDVRITGSVVSSGLIFGVISNNFILNNNNIRITSSTIGVSSSGDFIVTVSSSIVTASNFIVSSSGNNQIRGDVLFVGDLFDVRNSNILLGNGPSDNIRITGSVFSSGSTFEAISNNFTLNNNNNIRITSSTVRVSSSGDQTYIADDFIVSSSNVRITGSIFSSGLTFEAISNNFTLNNNNLRISSSTIGVSSSGDQVYISNDFKIDTNIIRITSSTVGVSSSGDQTYIADDFDVLNNTFNVKSISGNSRFGVNITGSRFITGSLRHTGTTNPDIGSTTLNITVSSSYYQFVRQNAPTQPGSIVLPTGLTANETGLTFEIIYLQGAQSPPTPTLKISASDGTGLADYNLATSESRLIKCIYNYTFDDNNIGNGTGWIITAVTASL